MHGEAAKLRAFRRRVAIELKLPCAAPPNGTVVTIDCSRRAGIGDAASSAHGRPVVAGRRPVASGVPASIDVHSSSCGGESQDEGLRFLGSKTVLHPEAGMEKGARARLSAAVASCELRWVLDIVPPDLDPAQDPATSPVVVGSKRRRGQYLDDSARRATTAGQVMTEIIEVFRE